MSYPVSYREGRPNVLPKGRWSTPEAFTRKYLPARPETALETFKRVSSDPKEFGKALRDFPANLPEELGKAAGRRILTKFIPVLGEFSIALDVAELAYAIYHSQKFSAPDPDAPVHEGNLNLSGMLRLGGDTPYYFAADQGTLTGGGFWVADPNYGYNSPLVINSPHWDAGPDPDYMKKFEYKPGQLVRGLGRQLYAERLKEGGPQINTYQSDWYYAYPDIPVDIWAGPMIETEILTREDVWIPGTGTTLTDTFENVLEVGHEVLDEPELTSPTKRPATISILGPEGSVQFPGTHINAPPAAGTKERKVIANVAARSLVGLAANFLTEGADAIEAIHDALPPEAKSGWYHLHGKGGKMYWKKRRKVSPQVMLRDLYRHWDKVDVSDALKNLAKNEVEDRLIGKAGRAQQKASQGWLQQLGRPVGLGTGPAI